MSQVLDQLILGEVSKICTESFTNYNNCVLQQSPSPDFNPARDCLKYQFELQRCVKDKVPSVQSIQKNCVTFMKNYETCLMKNRHEANVKCENQLNDLRDCAETQLNLK
ncbi:hypothetical protein CANARDRAFT_26282 [[Candida] arabinofermentans NRRL YB-2248]|uniref:IMS import disulfide relay-system CHCH-CHCH-like Cx9C domain-containing protein n=1 Tax=[Candida] arabinofermentans NRRL YB-2248 TaxID=983967 RepID=A0A1E4T8N5_9ASCO|nr:hypothetical protein CANARDRAFT_26282 [[Candida] arabinofermentans NRRL YB-2248]